MKDKKEKNKKAKWHNKEHSQEKIKKKPFAKLKSDIDNNSRIFFATDQQVDNDHIINQSLEKADKHDPKQKTKKKKIFSLLFFIFNVI